MEKKDFVEIKPAPLRSVPIERPKVTEQWKHVEKLPLPEDIQEKTDGVSSFVLYYRLFKSLPLLLKTFFQLWRAKNMRPDNDKTTTIIGLIKGLCVGLAGIFFPGIPGVEPLLNQVAQAGILVWGAIEIIQGWFMNSPKKEKPD